MGRIKNDMKKQINKHPSVITGDNFQHENNVVIYENVRIGNNVFTGNNVIVYPDTLIGDNVSILDNAVVGKVPKFGPLSTRKPSVLSPLTIGDNVIIGTAVIIYRGTKIGSGAYIADQVNILENCEIGEFVVLGKGVNVQFEVKVGKRSQILNFSQITERAEIGDDVFVGPDVSTSTDTSFGRIKGKNLECKTVIRDKAMIGGNATLCPGIVIGENALVGAGAVVVNNVPAGKVVFGNPARVMCDVDKSLIL
jgi:UDP-2-acetamido-3-amino-2,3-dideoxy-glucuronate N-acetyltransferase